MKILIVEDNLTIRSILRKHLAPLGFPIEEAGTMGEALRIMNTIPQPGLVLLDIWLPDTQHKKLEDILRDGIGGIKEANPDAIVVVITADTVDGLGAIALKAGADILLLKMQMDSQRSLWAVVKDELEKRKSQPARVRVELGNELLARLLELMPPAC